MCCNVDNFVFVCGDAKEERIGWMSGRLSAQGEGDMLTLYATDLRVLLAGTFVFTVKSCER